MSLSTKPIKPPLHATNSWVISHARDLIDYDGYGGFEQWLDRTDSNVSENTEGDAGKSACLQICSSSDLRATSHPAGVLEDYDPDCSLLSQKTIVETLETVAAEMEASYQPDNPPSPVHTLSTPSLPMLDTKMTSGLESESERSRYLVCFCSGSNTLSSSMSLLKSKSQFLTVPEPAHTAQTRHSRQSQQGSGRYTYSHVYTDAFAHTPEIERCPSSMPSTRIRILRTDIETPHP
ncbi:hypothetical protein F5Y12DRAFT_581147 [Xylaria sp. FL1777]|nr:hypothetical protein F5Y12DRAFT_581147 [Xylaria sp. FL1777]